MNLPQKLCLGLLLPTLMLSATSCKKPLYPLCDNDAACKAHQEVCVNHHCQECADDSRCQSKYPGEKRICQAGRCQATGCQSNEDCLSQGPYYVCKDHLCKPECASDSECGNGQVCSENHCSTACIDNQGCGSGQYCNQGHCEAGNDQMISFSAETSFCKPHSSGEWLHLPTVHFGFDRYDIEEDVRLQLDKMAVCLKLLPSHAMVVVEGHCDDRGTPEYNLALGEKRANAVLSYLLNSGVRASVLMPRSKGENEPTCMEATERCWAQNRRVQFIQNK